MKYHITSDRTVHIHDPSELLTTALEARTQCMLYECKTVRESASQSHQFIAAHNMRAVWGGAWNDESSVGLFRTGRLSRRVKNRRKAVRDGFRFTIEGLPAEVFKIEPVFPDSPPTAHEMCHGRQPSGWQVVKVK